MLFQYTFTYFLSTATLFHVTLAESSSTGGTGWGWGSLDPCNLDTVNGSNTWQPISFGSKFKGSPFCLINPHSNVIQSLSIWSNTSVIGAIRVDFVDGNYKNITTSVIDHLTLQKFDLYPGNKMIKDVYGEPPNDVGSLEGIALTLSDGSILRAGKNVTVPLSINPTADRSYLAGISGCNGTHGIEQLTFHLASQLDNNTNPDAW